VERKTAELQEQPEDIIEENENTSNENISDENGSADSSEDTGDTEVSYGLSDDAFYEIDELKEKIEQRKKVQTSRVRKTKIRTWTIILLVIASISLFIFSLSGFFTVDSIEVRGNSHFTPEEIINIGHASPGRNLIYDARKKEIVEYLEKNPYIKSADVRRKLPSVLVISVKERSELFAFGYDDDYLIMDGEGTLLRKTRTEPKLTIVEGIVVNRIKLGETIGAEKPEMLEKCIDLMKSMQKNDLYFMRLDLKDLADNGNIVRANVYENLVIRSDYDILLSAMEDGKVHAVLEKLVDDGIIRGTVTFNDDGTASYNPEF
jgi:cell division protein FtsQ